MADPTLADISRQDALTGTAPTTTAILSSRGTFYRVSLTDKYEPGIYAIDELNRLAFGQFQDFAAAEDAFSSVDNAAASPVLILGVRFNQTDIVSQTPCLNNNKVFYSFGQNFGQAVINGEILLGPLGDISKDGVDRLMDFFWKHRVSVSNAPISISASENTYAVYLTGLTVMEVDVNFHILPFVFYGTLLDLGRDSSSNINPTSLVLTAGGLESSSLFQALTVRREEGPLVGESVATVKPTPAETAATQAVVDQKQKSGSPATADMVILQRQVQAKKFGSSDMDQLLSPDERRYKEIMDVEQYLNETDPEGADKFRTDSAGLKAIYGQRVLREYSSDPNAASQIGTPVVNQASLDKLDAQNSNAQNYNKQQQVIRDSLDSKPLDPALTLF